MSDKNKETSPVGNLAGLVSFWFPAVMPGTFCVGFRNDRVVRPLNPRCNILKDK
jgi:hypothetical protein